MEEVYQYGKALSDKPRITVLNKIDAFSEDERKLYKEQLVKIIDEPVFMISAEAEKELKICLEQFVLKSIREKSQMSRKSKGH